MIALDRDAKIKDGGHDVVSLKLRPQTYRRWRVPAVRISRRLEIPPGHYQLRVGVRDGVGGAVGPCCTISTCRISPRSR